jgi:peptide methionine sulfoxide reductase msrA/msrB
MSLVGAESVAPKESSDYEQITFGSGCFWCTEAVFAELAGVKSAVSGYSGGRRPNPTYEQVCTGATGHAEVVQVTFDPKVISVAELLEVFWKTHDPTTLNQQGADHGTQYRSAVFYHNEHQRAEAEKYKQKLDESGAFDAPIVTEITKFDKFYPAEKYHQEYFSQNPDQAYCRAVVRPKVEKFRKAFADKLKGNESQEKASGEAKKSDGAAKKETDPEKIDWSKVDWKKRLTDEQYYVTRQAGTERAFTGKYWNFFGDGQYKCVNCGLPLFDSSSKFESHCGWPSFDRSLAKNAITEVQDRSHGMVRTEIRCRRCGAHLGHVFDDGPTDTGVRYCVNSASTDFVEREELEDDAKDETSAATR